MSDTVYFASDVHLGAGAPPREAAKERAFVAFLDGLAPGDTLYLLGDVFDFWFDFDAPPPAAYRATLRALRRCVDRGVAARFMGGNHDHWARVGEAPGWLEREIGLELLDDPHRTCHQGWRLLLTHGDALEEPAGAYRWVRTVLRHPLAIAGFRLLPARFGYWLGDRVSRFSRSREHERELERYRARLVEAAGERLADADLDAVIAGHVHHPERRETGHGVYLNLGDWIDHRTYGRLRDGELVLVRHGEG
ncbi:MAG: UDP-2,3-diacylglucosamine diphosphatase [Gemmatimonadota bacterium]|nr:UDP-2,3-diacylglucosamine diphosphatase [Gemmatimonadota bacterium]